MIPTDEIFAPTIVLDDVRELPGDISVLSCYGTAKGVERLPEYKKLRYLWISGIPAKKADFLQGLSQVRRLVLSDYRINTLHPISNLQNLHELAVVGSSKLKSLEGIESLQNLRSLILLDNCYFDDLTPLAQLQRLQRLCVEGGIWKILRVRTLEPISHLKQLTDLRLATVRTADKSLRSLHSLRNLRHVFISKKLPAKEVQALANALPLAHGKYFDPYRKP